MKDTPKVETGPIVSEAQIAEFTRGPIWARMLWCLKERKKLNNVRLRRTEGVPVYRAQGALDEDDWLELLPKLMLDQLKQRRKEEAKSDVRIEH